MPSLEIDRQSFTQSNALSRYEGKLSGLYPEDLMQVLYCDEVFEVFEDLNLYVVQTFGLKDEELKNVRLQLMEGRLTVFVNGLGELFKRGVGCYFEDNQLTIADLKMFGQLKQTVLATLIISQLTLSKAWHRG